MSAGTAVAVLIPIVGMAAFALGVKHGRILQTNEDQKRFDAVRDDIDKTLRDRLASKSVSAHRGELRASGSGPRDGKRG